MPELVRDNRIKDLFNEALELDDDGRATLLQRAAAEDPSIELDVRVLIGAHARAGRFLCEPDTPRIGAHESGANRPGLPAGEAIGDCIGRYHLLDVIGEGGFGRVYRAEQREPIVLQAALKIIKPGMDTRQAIARFEAERQTLAMMRHPSIAAVFDAGATSEGRLYFVMEYVDGVAITNYCDEHCLSVEQRLQLFIQVCNAVQHAHTKGIIHRDLKPSNLLVTVHDGMPVPKVIDFGIAKATSGRLGDVTTTMNQRGGAGTPQYMSPEQADDSEIDIDTRSDVYSLGVVLYELLAGVSPFDSQRLHAAGIGEWQRIIREEEPPKPSTRLSSLKTLTDVAAQRGIEPKRLPARLSGDLDWITLKSLEKDRDRRYRSAADLAEDLRRHLSHEPVLAGPPGGAYRVKKFVRRHRVGVLATCVVALAIVVGAVGLTVGLVQARDSAQTARNAAQEAEAVNEFMQDILSRVKPQRDGADVRLFEVMDEASASVSQRFAGHPLLEARVRDLLGGVYFDLSMWSKAKAEFKCAMELWQEYADADDPRGLLSERLYVGSAINNQQVGEVESRLPALAERTRSIFGPNDVSTLDVQRAIGIVHMLHGRIDEAESIFLDVRSRLLAHGDDDALQFHTLQNLIRVSRMRSSGADPATRAAMVARIEPLAREQVNRAVRAYGPSSLIALDAQVGWAAVLADQRQYAAAAQAAQAVLKGASGRLGDCHVICALAMEVLADAAHRSGDSAAAAALKLKRIECARHSGNAMEFVVCVSDALPILDRGERWSEGEALARELLKQLQDLGGGHGDMLFDTEVWIARFVSLQGRLDEAETMFQSLLSAAEKEQLTATVRSRVHLFHGSNLCRLGEFEQSETEVQTAANALDDFRLGTRTVNPDDVLIEYIALYRAWGKPERAREFEIMREQTLANLPIDPS